jgi:hypothetical protein
MEVLSSTYGWTLEQIRNTDEGDIKAYIDIISIRNKNQLHEIKKNKR